jgi:hypothetical protein
VTQDRASARWPSTRAAARRCTCRLGAGVVDVAQRVEHLVDGEQRAQLSIPYLAHQRRESRSVNTLQQVNSPRTAKSRQTPRHGPPPGRERPAPESNPAPPARPGETLICGSIGQDPHGSICSGRCCETCHRGVPIDPSRSSVTGCSPRIDGRCTDFEALDFGLRRKRNTEQSGCDCASGQLATGGFQHG